MFPKQRILQLVVSCGILFSVVGGLLATSGLALVAYAQVQSNEDTAKDVGELKVLAENNGQKKDGDLAVLREQVESLQQEITKLEEKHKTASEQLAALRGEFGNVNMEMKVQEAWLGKPEDRPKFELLYKRIGYEPDGKEDSYELANKLCRFATTQMIAADEAEPTQIAIEVINRLTAELSGDSQVTVQLADAVAAKVISHLSKAPSSTSNEIGLKADEQNVRDYVRSLVNYLKSKPEDMAQLKKQLNLKDDVSDTELVKALFQELAKQVGDGKGTELAFLEKLRTDDAYVTEHIANVVANHLRQPQEQEQSDDADKAFRERISASLVQLTQQLTLESGQPTATAVLVDMGAQAAKLENLPSVKNVLREMFFRAHLGPASRSFGLFTHGGEGNNQKRILVKSQEFLEWDNALDALNDSSFRADKNNPDESALEAVKKCSGLLLTFKDTKRLVYIMSSPTKLTLEKKYAGPEREREFYNLGQQLKSSNIELWVMQLGSAADKSVEILAKTACETGGVYQFAYATTGQFPAEGRLRQFLLQAMETPAVFRHAAP